MTGRLAVAGAAGLGVPGLVSGQPKLTLKLSHYLPPAHGLHTDFMEPWSRELEAKTQGAVTVQISPGTSALASARPASSAPTVASSSRA